MSYLAVPRYGKEINTLEEAAKELSKVHVYSYLFQRYRSPDKSDVLYRLRPKFVHTVTYPEWFGAANKTVKQGEKRAFVLEDRQSAIFVRRKDFTQDGFSLIRRVPECIVSAGPVAYAARRLSPFAARADAVVAQLVAAGLVAAFERRADPRRAAAFSLTRVRPGARPLRPYSLAPQHLSAAFALWAAGMAAAGAVAGLERLRRRLWGRGTSEGNWSTRRT